MAHLYKDDQALSKVSMSKSDKTCPLLLLPIPIHPGFQLVIVCHGGAPIARWMVFTVENLADLKEMMTQETTVSTISTTLPFEKPQTWGWQSQARRPF